MPEKNCAVCGFPDLLGFLKVENLPVHSAILWKSAEEARNCPRGDLDLYLCRACGYIGNRAFNPSLLSYSGEYDNTLHHSPFYQSYARKEARYLMEKFGLRGKTVLEVGCGKGDFLALLCELGDNRGIGFDPSYDGKYRDREAEHRLTFIRDFYGPEHARYTGDFVLSRQVLEHIDDPVGFAARTRGAVREGGLLYIEVPNAGHILEDGAVWDLIYEHASYFTDIGLRNTLRQAGIRPESTQATFEGQNLTVEARPQDWPLELERDPERLAALERQAMAFGPELERKAMALERRIRELSAQGRRVAAWGAGARATTLLNMLRLDEPVRHVVDLNPNKHGRYVGGKGQRIVPPESLKELRPDVLLVANCIYRDEIAGMIGEMDLQAEILCA